MNEFLRLLELTDSEHPEPGAIMVKGQRRQRAAALFKALMDGEPIDGRVIEMPEDPLDAFRLVAGKVILERLSAIDPDLAMPACSLRKRPTRWLFRSASRGI